METVLEVQDLYLSAAIVTFLKIEPSYKTRNKKTSFCFVVSDDLYLAIRNYNSGAPVDVQEYAGNIKRLRGEMLNRRNS